MEHVPAYAVDPAFHGPIRPQPGAMSGPLPSPLSTSALGTVGAGTQTQSTRLLITRRVSNRTTTQPSTIVALRIIAEAGGPLPLVQPRPIAISSLRHAPPARPVQRI